ncbi:MAG: IS1634 family transposase, partial [Deltaproteobacteria bacterium]|nr:IS1634 family transposase [Deltaproteobacteria bacterium]
MGALVKKMVNGRAYYHYEESKQVDGMPKVVFQKYLGSADKLLELAQNPEKPIQDRVLHSVSYECGMVTLLYDLAKRLDLVGIIDSFVPKRRQGASVGSYILAEAINRVVAPSSTEELQHWHETTYLPHLTNLNADVFSGHNFWKNANKISEKALESIEDAILSKMLAVYEIDISNLIYDATNLFTYIDATQESQSATFDRCKSKRNDLRVVALALLASQDFSIPLMHETCLGNWNDAKEFVRIMNRLKNSRKILTSRDNDIAAKFDRSNNSDDDVKSLDSFDNPINYVGRLKKNQAKELWAVPKEQYTPLIGDGFTEQSAYRMEVDVFGERLTALIVHDPKLEKSRLQDIKLNIEKTRKLLSELSSNLYGYASGGIVEGIYPTVDGVKNSLKNILKTEYMEDIFKYKILQEGGNVYLSFGASKIALDKIRRDGLGKTALFTNRSDFSNEEIVGAYRSACHAEHAFKQMKDPEHLTTEPLFH